MYANAIASFELKTFLKSLEGNYEVPSVFLFYEMIRNAITSNYIFGVMVWNEITKYEVCFSSTKWFGTEFRDFSSAKCLRTKFHLFCVPRKKNFLGKRQPNRDCTCPKNTSQIYQTKLVFLPYRQPQQSCHFNMNCVTSKVEIFCYNHDGNKLMRPDVWILIKSLCQKAVIFYSKLQRRVAVHNQTYYSVSFKF